ncbi:hypothetical protein [Bartonella sp. AC134YNZD]|uniref:hypothetical protein n=1 Tax=Bartonella sp. AC134YNZD TaxID=3243446 RepID=UPI0035D05A85
MSGMSVPIPIDHRHQRRSMPHPIVPDFYYDPNMEFDLYGMIMPQPHIEGHGRERLRRNRRRTRCGTGSHLTRPPS